MLVLSRKKGEIIRIGDDILVTIVEVQGNKVRVGVSAPRSVVVHRQEVWLAIHKGESNAEGGEATVAGDEEWAGPDPDLQV